MYWPAVAAAVSRPVLDFVGKASLLSLAWDPRIQLRGRAQYGDADHN